MEWIRKESCQHMDVKESGPVVYLSFPLLEKTGLVKHGFSTRMGGVSRGMYSSMNLSFNRGDAVENVRENYRRMAEAFGTRTENMVLSQQTHTTNIRVVTAKDRGKGIHRESDYTDIDGLVTNEPDVMLVTSYADCVPIYLVDVKQKAIGLCHSGWRGTVGKISQKMLQIMKQQYRTEPADVVAAIGPSICRNCYEVSEDVIEAFLAVTDADSLTQIADKKDNGRYQLDLWKANELWLSEAGVLQENIQITDICTCCNSKLLFSHRASQGKRGNLAAFLQLI